MSEPDIRQDAAKSRRLALGCLWVFMAGPAALGIVISLAGGGPGFWGWLLITAAILGTAFMVVAFVRTYNLANIQHSPGVRRSKFFGGSDEKT